jgi:O-antigen/teichoic acid export membrane protein/peptidoglycan/xylan/chitin deacetylase (PgdA/CDA1 family)
MTSTKKSIGISFATQYVELAIQFLSVLVLARVLAPADIGTYSVAAFLMTLLHVFRDFGVVQYLIQERDLTRAKIQSAMGVAILLAMVVAAVMLACSGAIARFYNNPAIEQILWVMAASFAVSPFGSLLIGIFRRDFNLRAIFYIKTISALSHVAVALTMALHGYGALSLAWANFAGILSFGIAANLMRPKGFPLLPRFDNMGAILSFGGVSSLGNAANIAGTNMPDLVIGKVMNMAAVGYFSRATGLVTLFTRLITGALLPLVLPYFAEMRREGKELAGPYVMAVEQLTALAWPFFGALALLAYPMVRALYGPQWDASVPIVQLLCVAGAVASISLIATQVMVANGQVRQATYCQLIAQPLRIGAVIAASAYGLQAFAAAIIVSEFVTLAVVSWFLDKAISVSPLRLVRACAKSALVALCAAIVPLLVNLFWNGDAAHPWPPLLVGIAGAAVGWIGSLLLTGHSLGGHLLALAPVARLLGKHGADASAPAMKLLTKAVAYRSGLLGAYHRLRNRRQLTVVMFHRILPATDARHAGADPEWTMTPESLRHCLRFFRRHYQVVSPEQVFAALRGEARLPPTSLLVTFDDGWRDTAEFAQPILDEFAVPALIFVAGAAVNQADPFWEERVFSFLATHPDGMAQMAAALADASLAAGKAGETDIRTVINRLGQLDKTARDALLAALPAAAALPPAMLDHGQLTALAAAGNTIGGHGMVHQPLTRVADLGAELQQAQAAIAGYLDQPVIESMSFPHGAYSSAVIAQCHAVGYRYLFSSDAHLNALGGNAAQAIGRIHISERAISDPHGRFQPSLLATWLFLRPVEPATHD